MKVIVEEIRQAIPEGELLKNWGAGALRSLIQLPYLWLEQHPWQPGQSRVSELDLTPHEQEQIEAILPPKIPDAQLIKPSQFKNLIELLYGATAKNDAGFGGIEYS